MAKRRTAEQAERKRETEKKVIAQMIALYCNCLLYTSHTGISDVHLKKVFFSLTNMTLTEYVRNRRLSEANYDLMQGEKVTDVAFKYNYQSLDGFSRAFKNWSGILPSDVNRQGA